MKTSNKTISPWFWVPTLYFAEGVPYFVVNNISVMMFTKMGVFLMDMAFFNIALFPVVPQRLVGSARRCCKDQTLVDSIYASVDDSTDDSAHRHIA